MIINRTSNRLLLFLLIIFLAVSCEKEEILREHEEWGLGKNLTELVENDRIYD